MSTLLIVESPAKAKKIQKFLKDKDIVVLSSYGHITNLDTDKLDEMIHNNFTPLYKNLRDKSKIIKELKNVGKGKEIILAADDDREGDGIAWHCGNLLKVNYKIKNRITFNEITKSALEKSLENKHVINMDSVNSQRCRQLLDLMIGYKLSPLLWRHIETKEKGLSAGRVQSTLLRMLQAHEEKIKNYECEVDYICKGIMCDIKNDNSDYEIQCNFIYQVDEIDIDDMLLKCQKNRIFEITERSKQIEKRYPPSPLITSTLQQSAQNELGFPIKMTMDIAQKLYDNGRITYMRTDSTMMSEDFKSGLERKICSEYGSTYYKNHIPRKVKGSQDAHECIRPTDINYKLNDKYTESDKKLYNLIMKYTITSHMKPAKYGVSKIKLTNKEISQVGYFEGKTKKLIFDGYLKYSNTIIHTQDETFDDIETCYLSEVEIKEVETNPPQYYNESTIVKKLETSGVGRPSTYASIVSTLYSRKYTIITDIDGKVKKEPYSKLCRDDTIEKGVHEYKTSIQKKRIRLTDLGELVVNYLVNHFSDMICVEFTAGIEEDLDKISEGTIDYHEVIKKVYNSFYPIVERQMGCKRVSKDAIYIGEYEIKTGKYGPYISHQGINRGLSSYIDAYKKKLNEFTEEDIKGIMDKEEPKNLGEYKGIGVIIMDGPFSKYMRYNKKIYKIPQKKNYILQECISYIR